MASTPSTRGESCKDIGVVGKFQDCNGKPMNFTSKGIVRQGRQTVLIALIKGKESDSDLVVVLNGKAARESCRKFILGITRGESRARMVKFLFEVLGLR